MIPRFAPLLVVAACSMTAAERWDSIQGEEWLLTTIDGAPILAGTEVSLTFTTGRLYGRAVNRYAGPYVRADEELKIESIGATRIFLDKPTGAMDQEGRYLKLLEQAERWEISGGRLDLKHKDKSILAFKLRSSTAKS
jgi:heat shock protein HslJ